MRYLVAVSGGIDSVVLLDQLVKADEHELIVAHFDHGIREDSAADARFVEELAASYRLPFVSIREELGKRASEELARTRRYLFLRTMAKEHNATIVTAHHADDVIETIAINLQRGTGWRGVAVLQTAGIFRPLLDQTKQQLRDYALTHQLEWVEDATNATDAYLRNRLRSCITTKLPSEDRQKLRIIWHAQVELKQAIDAQTAELLEPLEQSRYLMTHADNLSALELLRAVVVAQTNASPTRPQLQRALLAIKTARPHTMYEIGSGVTLRFTARTFIVETL
ncbi:MAG TPA: tRNA lysidine(34) synthetase TilS [Candidatus Saccharimonadales bacterium]